jgi:hypothetical protein
MKDDTTIILKSLEADVAELQALVRDLDCQERELRKAVIKNDALTNSFGNGIIAGLPGIRKV